MAVPLTERMAIAKKQKVSPDVFVDTLAQNKREIWPFQIFKIFNGTEIAEWTDDTLHCPFTANIMKIRQITFQDDGKTDQYGLLGSPISLNDRPMLHIVSGLNDAFDGYEIPITLATNSAANFRLYQPGGTNNLGRTSITPTANSLLIIGGELWSKI